MPELDIKIFPGRSDDIYADIFLAPENRPGYSSRDNNVELPVYLARIYGVDEEAAYINRLFDLEQQLKREKPRYLRLEASLPKTVPSEWGAAFNERWQLVAPMRSPKAADISEIYLRSGLLGTFNGTERQCLKSSISLILGLFISKVNNKDITKNFLIKQLYWLQTFFVNQLGFYKPGGKNAALLFWGAPSRDEAYFLLLLSALGCDVLCFEPAGGGKWDELPHIEDYSFALQYPSKADLPEFPRAPRGKHEETVAYRAEQEIHQMLHTPETGAFMPWQLESYFPAPFSLTTTLDELLLLWPSEARFRPGFEVRDQLVMLPSIFAKIDGVASDWEAYLEKIQGLRQESLAIKEIRSLPIPAAPQGGIDQNLLDSRGFFDLEKVVRSKPQAFSRLRPAMQKMVIDKINELCSLSGYLRLETSLANKFRIFRLVMGLDRGWLDMLQQFDYPFQVPKLLLFDKGEPGLNDDDAIILAFFHLVGFDIVIICPGGYADLEQYFGAGYYQVHRLDQFRFDVQAEVLDKKPRRGLLDWLRH